MILYTIGFSKKTAKYFFELLRKNGVKTLIDIRRNPHSQLSGFAKAKDLEFFIKELINGKYIYLEIFAPSEGLIKNYRKKKIIWLEYEQIFNKELENKKEKISQLIKNIDFNKGCLMCSEDKPDRCHRRLVAEFLKKEFFPDLKIKHLI